MVRVTLDAEAEAHTPAMENETVSQKIAAPPEQTRPD